MTNRPPTASCAFSGGGISDGAAVTMIASNGAASGHPPKPSPVRVRTLRIASPRPVLT
jgi:hypothetical protein